MFQSNFPRNPSDQGTTIKRKIWILNQQTKRQKKEKDKSEEQQYPPPKQVPNNLELHMKDNAKADVENVREINNVPQEEKYHRSIKTI